MSKVTIKKVSYNDGNIDVIGLNLVELDDKKASSSDLYYYNKLSMMKKFIMTRTLKKKLYAEAKNELSKEGYKIFKGKMNGSVIKLCVNEVLKKLSEDDLNDLLYVQKITWS